MSRGAGLVAAIWVARLLGVREFGEYGLIQITALTAAGLVSFGFGTAGAAALAAIPESDGRGVRVAAVSVLWGAAAVTAVVAAAALLNLSELLSWIGGNESQVVPWRLGTVVFCSASMWAVLQSLLVGAGAASATTGANLFYALLLLSNTAVLTTRLGLLGAMWALVIATVGACGACAWALYRTVGPHDSQVEGKLRLDWDLLWNGSLPGTLSAVATAPVNWWTLAMLTHRPSGLVEVGIFNAGNQWRTAAVFLPQTLGAVWVRYLAVKGRDDRVVLSEAEVRGVGMAAGFAGLGGISLAVASPLISRIYGGGFEGVGPVVRLLSVAVVGQVIAGFLGGALIARKRMWTTFCLNALWAVVLVGTASGPWGRNAISLSRAHAYAYAVLTVSGFVALSRDWARSRSGGG